MATNEAAPAVIDAEVATPEKRESPDGNSVAIRTIFEDDMPGAIQSWLAIDYRGISTYLTEGQVAKWKRIGS